MGFNAKGLSRVPIGVFNLQAPSRINIAFLAAEKETVISGLGVRWHNVLRVTLGNASLNKGKLSLIELN